MHSPLKTRCSEFLSSWFRFREPCVTETRHRFRTLVSDSPNTTDRTRVVGPQSFLEKNPSGTLHKKWMDLEEREIQGLLRSRNLGKRFLEKLAHAADIFRPHACRGAGIGVSHGEDRIEPRSGLGAQLGHRVESLDGGVGPAADWIA